MLRLPLSCDALCALHRCKGIEAEKRKSFLEVICHRKSATQKTFTTDCHREELPRAGSQSDNCKLWAYSLLKQL